MLKPDGLFDRLMFQIRRGGQVLDAFGNLSRITLQPSSDLVRNFPFDTWNTMKGKLADIYIKAETSI